MEIDKEATRKDDRKKSKEGVNHASYSTQFTGDTSDTDKATQSLQRILSILDTEA